jgi:hypothetical protein
MVVTQVMSKFTALVFAGLLASSAACVSANQGGTAVASADNGDGGDEEGEIVCRTERPTGSNIAQRVCYDKRETDERRDRDQQGLRDSGRYGCEGAGCSGGGD